MAGITSLKLVGVSNCVDVLSKTKSIFVVERVTGIEPA
jgi:hypothetical protein